MNKKYLAVALVLASAVLASPAMAGIANVEGNGKAKASRKQDNVFKTYHNYIKGSGSDQYGHSASAGKRSLGTSQSYLSTSNAIISNAQASLAAGIATDVVEAGRSAYTGMDGAYYMSSSNGKVRYHTKGIDGWGTYTLGWYSSSVSSNGPKLTNSKDVGTNIEYKTSNNAIMVGDVDNIDDVYAAQGTLDRVHHYDTYEDYDVIYQVNVDVRVSPIILDLDGDGKIEASHGKYLPHKGDFTKGAVMFDFYGNGFPVACEWVGSNDGLLCRPNEDGSVKGTNLFGTANGFDNGYDELASLDMDQNGAIEGAELEGLMVWTDTNCNGIADKGELKSLESLGITSISTNHNNFCGSFVRDGKTYKTFDWWPSIRDCRKINIAKK